MSWPSSSRDALAAALCLGLGIGLVTSRVLQYFQRRPQQRRREAIRHVVLFAFKEGSPTDRFVAAFDALVAQLPIVIEYERGENNSTEGLSKGFSHCFTLTFASESERDAYLFHPLHTRFVEEWVKPHVLADVLVFDYKTTGAR